MDANPEPARPTYFGVTEMKKSHKWNTSRIFASCPHCHKEEEYFSWGEGEILMCKICGKQFQLGKQR